MATISKSGISNGNTISATHITNIIDALDGTTANNLVFAGPVTGSAPISASAGFTGSLMGTASWAANATNATTAGTANSVAFSSVTSLPSSLNGYGGSGGVSEVKSTVTGPASINVSTLTNGAFYPINANAGTVTYTVNVPGGGTTYGFEVTFFAIDATQDITFSPSASVSIVCSGSLANPKLSGTGAAAVLKYISSNTWALIGSIK